MLRILFFSILVIFGCKTSKTINTRTPIELVTRKYSTLYLDRIEIHKSYTKLNFTFKNKQNSKLIYQAGNSITQYININPEIRLYDNENLKSYRFIKGKRISIAPAQIAIRAGDNYHFSLIFQKIEKFTTKIDIIECENNLYTNCWNFYNISLENEIVEYFEK